MSGVLVPEASRKAGLVIAAIGNEHTRKMFWARSGKLNRTIFDLLKIQLQALYKAVVSGIDHIEVSPS